MADFDQILLELRDIKNRQLDVVGTDEFVALLSQIIDIFSELKQGVETGLDQSRQDIQAKTRELEQLITQLEKKKDTPGPKGPPGPRGEPGQDGRSPDPSEVADQVRRVFFQLKSELKGEDGRTPVVGIDFFTRREQEQFKDSVTLDVLSEVSGQNMADNIARGLETLTDEQRLDYNALRNTPNLENIVSRRISEQGNRLVGGGMLSVFDTNGKVGSGTSIKFTGSGVNSVSHDGHQATVDISSSGGSTLTSETPTGTVDGSNTTFTVNNEPLFVIVDGMFWVAGNGYTYSGGTITVDSLSPPRNFIRSFYNS